MSKKMTKKAIREAGLDKVRLASEAPFPYDYAGRVCYFERMGLQLRQVSRRDEQRIAAQRALRGESELFAVWPGQWSSDLFLIDDPAALVAAIGEP